MRYMSPEALRGESLTVAADIYSLGITMWQLKCRKLPYFWIECNDTVAYQVVKNDLRPDDELPLHFEPFSKRPHVNCFCQNLSPTAMSSHSLEHIKNMLRQSEESTDCEAVKESLQILSEIVPTNVKATTRATTIVRKPFQVLNARPEMQKSDECKEITTKYNFKMMFSPDLCWRGKFKEAIYEDIYKSCWYSDIRLRSSSKDLLLKFRQLLK